MWRLLPILVPLVLSIYCVIDCIQTDESVVRNLPKPLWILLILFAPLVGGVAWLVAGRPPRRRPGPAGEGGRRPMPPAPKGPDDDPEFLRSMRNHQEERRLRGWEEELRHRERELRGEGGEDSGEQGNAGRPPAGPAA